MINPRFLLFFILSIFTSSIQAADTNKIDFDKIVSEINITGDKLIANYQVDSGIDTADEFSNLYFDVFEASGMEVTIGMKDAALKTKLESKFSTIIGLATRNKPKIEVDVAWQLLRNELLKTALQQQKTEASFISVIIQSFLILLREGFEAILVVTALLTYLHRQGADEKKKVIYYGVGIALGLSLVTAWLLHSIFQVSNSNQEALEGVVMLVASAILFYVSYWLISKAESVRWQQYIKDKMDTAIGKGSLFTLGFAAFLAVYREGAETVLFYQALSSQVDGQFVAIIIGIASASVALIGVYWAMHTASIKLPLGIFFGVTSILLYYLSITFAGGGILELQEASWVGIT
ncbi:MAG: FTR1 family iron permease, partial [Candidatus Marithrix sp.]|nr:FTR1 family iron permease [Candidatus Marithrix sp.]